MLMLLSLAVNKSLRWRLVCGMEFDRKLEFIKEFDFEGIETEFDHAFWSCLVGWNWNEIVKGKVRNRKNEPKIKNGLISVSISRGKNRN